MIRSDFHVHTLFSDGTNTPEEMVVAAIEKGMTAIGFSDHSYTAFDESYCMRKERIEEYCGTVAALREKYRRRIRILCGIEQDFYSDEPTERYDYVIGSVHYLRVRGDYIPVDESPDILRRAAETYFGGDMYRLVDAYYRTVAQVAEKTRADIIGHFDLITKFNRDGALFCEEDARYRASAEAAVNALVRYGKPFEINTGAVARGYRHHPYPSQPLTEAIAARGGRFILSSDSHTKDTLCFRFDEFADGAGPIVASF